MLSHSEAQHRSIRLRYHVSNYTANVQVKVLAHGRRRHRAVPCKKSHLVAVSARRIRANKRRAKHEKLRNTLIITRRVKKIAPKPFKRAAHAPKAIPGIKESAREFDSAQYFSVGAFMAAKHFNACQKYALDHC